jgi:hypothetical protein
MENGPTRAAFWKRFISDKCGYPAPALLRNQFEHAEFSDFCECGCNSFGIRVDPAHVKPLLPPAAEPRKGHAAIFTADFRMPDEKTLEIIIFADDHGHLDYVEVDCCGNSYPVPDEVAVEEPAFHTWAAESLFRER